MKKLLFLLLTSCTYTTIPTPTVKPKLNEPEYYLPRQIYTSQLACNLGMTSPGSIGLECNAIPKMPQWADCLPNYHKEKQLLCTDNQSEPSSSRIVCHLNVAKGYTNLCGLECTMHIPVDAPPIILPPSLDKQDVLHVE